MGQAAEFQLQYPIMPDDTPLPSHEELRRQLAQLEAQLAGLQGRLPAHSLTPSMLARMDALDEQISGLRRRLVAWHGPEDATDD